MSFNPRLFNRAPLNFPIALSQNLYLADTSAAHPGSLAQLSLKGFIKRSHWSVNLHSLNFEL